MVLKTKRLLLVGGFALALAGAVFMYFNNPASAGFYPPCFIKMLTGLNCSGCGTVRAAYALLHLDFVRAFSLNPLFVLLLPIAAYILLGYVVNTWTGRNIIPQVFNKTGWAIALIVLLLVYSVLRNIQAYPLTLLVP